MLSNFLVNPDNDEIIRRSWFKWIGIYTCTQVKTSFVKKWRNTSRSQNRRQSLDRSLPHNALRSLFRQKPWRQTTPTPVGIKARVKNVLQRKCHNAPYPRPPLSKCPAGFDWTLLALSFSWLAERILSRYADRISAHSSIRVTAPRTRPIFSCWHS